MLVRALSNKRKRQLIVGKIYAVLIESKEFGEIRIIDEAGGLSVYDVLDFEIEIQNSSSYEEINHVLVYKWLNYPSFLENYYNDDRKAINDLRNSQINIFKEDLDSEGLVKLITSKEYSNDEKMVFIDAIEEQITESSVEMLAKHFQSEYDVESDLLLSICKLLLKHQSQEVYDLFLMYFSEPMIKSNHLQDTIIEYFNNYY